MHLFVVAALARVRQALSTWRRGRAAAKAEVTTTPGEQLFCSASSAARFDAAGCDSRRCRRWVPPTACRARVPARQLQQGVRPRLGEAHAHHHHVRRARRHCVRRSLGLRGLQLGLVRAHVGAGAGPRQLRAERVYQHGNCSKACGPGLENVFSRCTRRCSCTRASAPPTTRPSSSTRAGAGGAGGRRRAQRGERRIKKEKTFNTRLDLLLFGPGQGRSGCGAAALWCTTHAGFAPCSPTFRVPLGTSHANSADVFTDLFGRKLRHGRSRKRRSERGPHHAKGTR